LATTKSSFLKKSLFFQAQSLLFTGPMNEEEEWQLPGRSKKKGITLTIPQIFKIYQF
jgi:hypothetical protein